MRRFRLGFPLCMLLAALSLAGCARIDPDQARICRIALPALYPAGTPLEVLSVSGGDGHAISVAHALLHPGRAPQEAELICRFAGGLLSAGRRELVAIDLDGQPLAQANLLFLKRFWLAEPASELSAPAAAPREIDGLPQLPLTAAIGLQHLLAGLPHLVTLMLLAPAYALVYGLVGRINLAFGELAALGGYGAGLGLLLADVWLGDSPVLLLVGALALSLAVAATHGEAIGRLVAVPLARRSGQAFLVATLGLSVLLLEYMHLAFGASSRWSPPVLNVPVAVARAGDFVVSVTEMALLSALAGAGALGLLALRMRRGHAGRAWRAVADDPGMAALCGVDPRDTLLGAVVTASLLAGLAGCIMTLHYGGIGFAGGLSIGLKALTAAVLGGIGSLAGAVLGALALGLAEALWSALMPIEFRDMAIYAGLVLLLALRPGGLLGFATGTPRRV